MPAGSSKPKSSLVLRNIYVMLAYAFDSTSRIETSSFLGEEFENFHELCAEILIQGIEAQFKRGLHHDYRRIQEELRTVRGRIDFASTIATAARSRGAIECEFDEYLLDTQHNRILKSVVELLLTEGKLSRHRRRRLGDILYRFVEVRSIAPRSIRWRDVHYTRLTTEYKLLHGVCWMVVEGLMQRESEGGITLASWLGEEAENRLYERFLLRYYQRHYPALKPSSPHISWDLSGDVWGEEQLPIMRSDVVLANGSSALVIDAKYYRSTMQRSPFGKATLHSGHLYQLLSYVINFARNSGREVSGLLLYAKTNEEVSPDFSASISGHRIAAKTLNLDAPWREVQEQLDAVVERSLLNEKWM